MTKHTEHMARLNRLALAKSSVSSISDDLTLAMHDGAEEMRGYWERRAHAELHNLALRLGYELVRIQTPEVV